ncbi:hypothetical protein CRM22_008503 [Opisthorchis felineus]|uniref:UPF0506 domain-containing protein n=1 Tax=Opisthorchis felineus TaxID=147828 RepID=A0A4S2LBJ4_OPIFE|nr:hypothetical protein CRM22_008503 [Opisthorchis felineus]
MWTGVIILVFTIMPLLYCSPLGLFGASCALLGKACSRTVFYKCCHSAVCSLVYPFVGVCVPCYSKGTMCLNGDECCDGSCVFNHCV